MRDLVDDAQREMGSMAATAAFAAAPQKYFLGADAFGGESAEESLSEQVGRLARDQVARRANETTSHNVGRDSKKGARFARVPMGAHTCEFCMMLASRGFVYHTKETAGEFGHYHGDCRCKVVAGFPEMEFYFKNGVKVSRGVDPKVEGYDPNVCAKLARKYEEIDGDSTLSDSQRKALKAAWSMSEAGDSPGQDPRGIADVFDDALAKTAKAFRRNKTQENYEATVGRFLQQIGDAFGIEMSGRTYLKKNGREIVGACPDGEELWAALRMLQADKKASEIIWIPETSANKTPDMIVDGIGVEIKTPKSMRKIPTLAMDTSEKRFDLYGSGDDGKNALFSLLSVGNENKGAVAAVLDRFVEDGSLDAYMIVGT